MRKITILMAIAALAVIFNISESDANIQIKDMMKQGKKVHDGTKNGLKVNDCSYCHTGTGIKMSKDQKFRKGEADSGKLKNFPRCGFSGCPK